VKNKLNFTKRDIIVVLGCVVFLLMNLGAVGSGGRRRAKEMVCLSNLHQWGHIWSMYCQDNDGYFCMESDEVGWPRGNWIIVLRPQWKTRTDILKCPMATKRLPTEESYGGPFRTYVIGIGGLSNQREEGSYGANCWIFNPRPGQTMIQQRPVEWNWKTPNVKGGNNIPVFGDTMLRGGGPFYQNGNPLSERIIPPEYNGQWIMAKNEMMHFCINRHNGAVNHLFMDWSVRKVGLKELWTLKWHREFRVNGFWTKAGGVQPSDWPQWMRNFKEY